MENRMKTDIRKTLTSLTNKLVNVTDDNDIRIAYEYATKLKNQILVLHQDVHFGQPGVLTAPKLTHCSGYVDRNGIAVLTIGEALPHTKAEQAGVLLGHWQSCVHSAIQSIAENSPIPRYEMALTGIHVMMPHGTNNSRIWDASNRAINLIINNLKGILFPDDNVEHMAFAVRGSWSDIPKTMIYVGDFQTQGTLIMNNLTG